MLKYSITCICLVALSLESKSQDEFRRRIDSIRLNKDAELRSKEHSPLQKKDRKAFTGLTYFEINPEWRKDVQFIRVDGGDTIGMPTSSGKVKKFYIYGELRFSHGQHNDTLWAYKRIYPEGYKPQHAPYLFIPFTDLTTGDESYGGGRYLDIGVPEASGIIELDFNEAYNPYCAYGDGFACPIPPKRNFINLSVEAGERAYHQ